MRKMYSENQIIDVIIRAIESGLIPIGSDVESFEGTSLLPTDVVFTDWTLHRAIKVGSILWIVMTGKITNNSASAVSPADLFSITLPSDVSSKIYRSDGTACNQAYSTETYILSTMGKQDFSNKNVTISCDVPNVLSINFATSSINAGASARVDLRVPIFLDVGE